jgi:ribosomal protein S18 acetylase RimI-like enzyme
MEIKRLNRAHIEEIEELWQELNDHHRALSAHHKDHFAKMTFRKRIEKLLKKEKLFIALAKEGNLKAGYCVATCNRTIGEIDSIYLKPEYRKKGIGERLMSEALRWLDRQDCKDIRVSIAEGNEGAIGFYRKFGFAERFTVMEMKKA